MWSTILFSTSPRFVFLFRSSAIAGCRLHVWREKLLLLPGRICDVVYAFFASERPDEVESVFSLRLRVRHSREGASGFARQPDFLPLKFKLESTIFDFELFIRHFPFQTYFWQFIKQAHFLFWIIFRHSFLVRPLAIHYLSSMTLNRMLILRIY